jgi:hypothetical protein
MNLKGFVRSFTLPSLQCEHIFSHDRTRIRFQNGSTFVLICQSQDSLHTPHLNPCAPPGGVRGIELSSTVSTRHWRNKQQYRPLLFPVEVSYLPPALPSVCPPARPSARRSVSLSVTGNKFIVSFIDEHTGYMWIYYEYEKQGCNAEGYQEMDDGCLWEGRSQFSSWSWRDRRMTVSAKRCTHQQFLAGRSVMEGLRKWSLRHRFRVILTHSSPSP